jgi:uncharacterized membrane protein YedE/YeeE
VLYCPTFATFVTLLAGMVARPAHRTVCGMLAGAGLVRVWHHSRAHRFFTTARWHPDKLGHTLLRLIIGASAADRGTIAAGRR